MFLFFRYNVLKFFWGKNGILRGSAIARFDRPLQFGHIVCRAESGQYENLGKWESRFFDCIFFLSKEVSREETQIEREGGDTGNTDNGNQMKRKIAQWFL